jgi:hypothetical protein
MASGHIAMATYDDGIPEDWYPGYFLDPRNAWKWMPSAIPGWLPSAMVRTPPAPQQSWSEPSPKPSYALFGDELKGARPKTLEEQLAELPTLLPDVSKPAPPKPNAGLFWGGLEPTPSQPEPWPDAPASAQKSPPPLFPRWPDYVMTTAGVPAKVAGWPWDVPGDVPADVPAMPVQWPRPPAAQPQPIQSAPPVPYTESREYWGAGPAPKVEPLWGPYLAPVPPAPDWNDVPTKLATSEADIFAQPSPLSWGTSRSPTEGAPAIDEAAAAEEARRKGAMRTGQWRRRGTQEYERPVREVETPAPQPRKVWTAEELRPQYAEQAEEVAAILNRRPDDLVHRATVLPLGETRDGRVVLAVPDILARPLHTLFSPIPEYGSDREAMVEHVLPLAELAMGAGMPFAKRGAVGVAGGKLFSPAETRGLAELFGKRPEGAQALLDRLAQGPVSLPADVTRQTLEKYAQVAQNAIDLGKDKIGTQALRLEAIRRLLNQR